MQVKVKLKILPIFSNKFSLTKKDIKVKIYTGDNMQTKEKKTKKLEIKITVKQIVILLVFLVAILFTIQVYFIYFDNGKTYGKEEHNN